MSREYICAVCGTTYTGYRADPSGMCRKCRQHPHYHGADRYHQKQKRKVTPLTEVAIAAREHGMSYGQYVARGLDQ